MKVGPIGHRGEEDVFLHGAQPKEKVLFGSFFTITRGKVNHRFVDSCRRSRTISGVSGGQGSDEGLVLLGHHLLGLTLVR